jgi:anti-anti-sigma factor
MEVLFLQECPSMRLKLELPDPSGVVCVSCVGTISQDNFTGGTDPLGELLGPSGYTRKVRLNLERVDYIDSSGIGWLVGHHRRFREAGGQLILCAVPPVVERVLRFCSLLSILHLEMG